MSQLESSVRTRVTAPRSKRKNTKTSNDVLIRDFESDSIYRLLSLSSKHDDSGEQHPASGLDTAPGMAYPIQTGVCEKRARSDTAVVSGPFTACGVNVPFTTCGADGASNETVGLFCDAYRALAITDMPM